MLRRGRPSPAESARPSWWPEGEPWPAEDLSAPQRSRSLRRWIAGLLIATFALFVIGALIVNHTDRTWDYDQGGPPPPGFWIGPLLLILIAAVVTVLVRKLTRAVAPLAEIMDATERVASGDYSARIAPRGPSDVQDVVRAFNTMTTRLEVSEEQRTHLFSDIAHELRTPLSVVQGTIEGMMDGVYPLDATYLGPILDQTRVIGRLLTDLQTMATADAGMLALHLEPTEVGGFLREVARGFGPAAAREGVDLLVDAPVPVTLDLDPVRMRQVLDNLVTNALRYTPRDGVVTIACQTTTDMVEITVRDTGRGMSADEASQVFERFAKSADSGGSGLGLPIARSLIEAHGGTIAAESTEGAGATVTTRLPRPTPG